METDKLTICSRCKGDAAYEKVISDEITITQCYGCGFQCNSKMTEGSDFLEEQMGMLPDIYKALMGVDEFGKVWMPTYVNLPEEGMVFVNGKNENDWKWGAVKSVKIPKGEQHKYPNPTKPGTFYTNRMDMETLKEFEEKNFMDALSYINVLPQ